MTAQTAAIVPGKPAALWPDVVRVTAGNAGMMTGPGTNTYVVGGAGHGVVVIDPGPGDPAHLDAVLAAAAGPVAGIAVTHAHPDHAPGAAALSARTGAPVMGFAARPGFFPDEALADDAVVEAGGLHLRAVHTPGHASDHLCYLLAERHVLFSGDHVMEGSTVVVAPPDGDMAEYLASLRRIAALRPPLAAIAPGHGLVIDDPAGAVAGYLAHRQDREDAIVAALGAAGEARPREIVAAVYTDVRPELHPVARYSVWAHLRKLAAEGRAGASDPADVDGLWRLT